MARICDKCGSVHSFGVVGCRDAARILKRNAEVFNRRVKYHMEHCPGCPDPEQHVRDLDELNNSRREPIIFGRHV